MRLLKFNEMRHTTKPKVTSDHIDKLNTMKATWKSFEDDQAWDFDYFWSKVEAYANDWNNRYHGGNGDVEYELEIENRSHSESVYNRSDNTGGYPVPGAPEDVEWRRRTGYIEAYIRTGGYSGGSCWDDEENYARPYETDYSLELEDLLKYVEHMLNSIIGHTRTSQVMGNLAKSNLFQEDDWSNYEYYGNSDDYRSYFITLWDLYVFLCKEAIL